MGIFRIDTLNTGHGSGAFVGGIFRALLLHRSSLVLLGLFTVLRVASVLLAMSIYAAMRFPLNSKRLI